MHRQRRNQKKGRRNLRKIPNNNGIVPLPSTRSMVIVQGENQPQAFPFTPASHSVPRVFRYAQKLTSDGTGSFLHRFSLRNLARAVDGTGTYEDGTNISNAYDVYKPIRFRLQLVPAFATTSFSVGSVLLAPDYEDNDLAQTVNTLATANAYADRVVIDPRTPSTTTFKIPKLESGTIPGTLATTPAVIQSGGFLDFQAPPYEGVVYAVGTGFPLNLTVFDAFLEMDCLVKFSR